MLSTNTISIRLTEVGADGLPSLAERWVGVLVRSEPFGFHSKLFGPHELSRNRLHSQHRARCPRALCRLHLQRFHPPALGAVEVPTPRKLWL